MTGTRGVCCTNATGGNSGRRRKLRDLVRGGHLGRPFYLDCARLNPGRYQADVNVILDLAPHDISICNFVLGSRPAAVTAWASRHVHPEHEDPAYLRLDYADLGVRADIHVSCGLAVVQTLGMRPDLAAGAAPRGPGRWRRHEGSLP